jgi:preprotein translocase subunit SecY
MSDENPQNQPQPSQPPSQPPSAPQPQPEQRQEEQKKPKERPSIIQAFLKIFPSIEKPLYKQSLNTKLMWTGIALALYLALANIPVAGLDRSSFPAGLEFIETLLGARFGSIMTLGIGPIVTAGIIMQLLVGSKIINWDMTKPETKKRFQSWSKFIAVIFAFVESAAFVLAGAIPVEGSGSFIAFVIAQFAMGGIIVILLDDLVQKWGFGSGISLFIAAGVGSQIFVGIFSPLGGACTAFDDSGWAALRTCVPSDTNQPSGRLWSGLMGWFAGRPPVEVLLNFLPIAATAGIFLFVVYMQSIKVEVPLAFSALRGFGRNWALKLFYTSNIPVILAAALLANMQLMGRVGVSPDPVTGLSCGLVGCFNEAGNPVSGLAYYLSAPGGTAGFGIFGDLILTGIVPGAEVLRAVIYMVFLGVAAALFSMFWVNTAGMDAKSMARQIDSAGMQIPGYRRDPRIIESVLARYIPALALIGGLFVGLLAGFADILGVIGTGTGILLTVMIIYNYYEELRNQRLDEAHPLIRKMMGEK